MSGTPEAVNPSNNASVMDVTDGTLLRGRISYRQPRTGHRSALEPVLMAAFVPARRGQDVIEAGCGAGAGLLCLASRVAGLKGCGIEADAATAALARSNLADNQMDWPVHLARLPDLPATLLQGPGFHHAFANPPWHRPDSSLPDDPTRLLARTAPPRTWHDWSTSLRRVLRHKGTLTLALPAASLDQAMAALHSTGFGSILVLPLWPKSGRPAKLCLLQATKSGRGDCRMLPGLILHTDNGSFTAETQAILQGSPLEIPKP